MIKRNIPEPPTFLRNWLSNFLKSLDAAFSRVAIAITIIAFLGVQLADVPLLPYVIYAFLAYILVLLAISKPPYVPPPNLSEPIDIAVVNSYLATTPRVGVVGLRKVGKTTFINATVARRPDERETAKPYGQFVLVPDTKPEKHVVLLDSVGAREHVHFLIQTMATTLVFIIDHSETSDLSAVDDVRINSHKELARQLIHAAVDNNVIVDRIIVVANKSDLWQADERSVAVVGSVMAEIVDLFRAAAPYRTVVAKLPFSNESRVDVASLLQEAS